MTPEQAVLPSLERIGVDPASVRWIVQSHLHLDHTGALAEIEHFPNAQVLVDAHGVRVGAPAGGVQRARVLPGGLRQARHRLGAARGVGRRLGSVRRRRRALLAHPGPFAGSPVLRDQAAERPGVHPRIRRREHDRPPEREGAAGLHHRRGRDVRSVRKLRRLAWRADATVVAATIRISGLSSSRPRRTTTEGDRDAEHVPRLQRAARGRVAPRSTTGGTTITSARTSRRRDSSRGQRFALESAVAKDGPARPHTHLALYEYNGDLARWRTDLEERIETGKIVLPEWFPQITVRLVGVHADRRAGRGT